MDRVLENIPPFDVDDSVEKSYDFCDAAEGDEGVDPGDGLVPQELAEFLEATDFDELRLLHFAEVGDEVLRYGLLGGFVQKSGGER